MSEKSRKPGVDFSIEEKERSLSINYRTLSIQTSDSIQARKYQIKKEKKVATISPDDDIAQLNYHTLPVNLIWERFECNKNLGLNSQTAAHHLQRNGKNVISPPKNNIIYKILGYFLGGFCSLIWFAAIIMILLYKPLGEPNPSLINLALGIVLIIAVVILTVFAVYQDWSTSRVMKSIKNILHSETLVIRDGQVQKIPATDLVVGDLVQINMGSKVPSDLRLVEVTSDMKFDRSILTGENAPVTATIYDQNIKDFITT
ncbi:1649_t:CDS:2 [Funneliformis mosseae]|uniref:1649_t:CDS:1 n=1 Tax=Funneliformis mosseae TaxID=27381 RepID=A0A9N9BH01_FUNMO|nr:1649_t:CDS:2 [Funneliformis mosseae]